MFRRAPKVSLTQEQQDELERFARSRTLAARLVERARIIVRAAAGLDNQEIAAEMDVCRQTVGRWRERFTARSVDGLEDRPRSGRPAHPVTGHRRDRPPDHPIDSGRGHPLEHPNVGSRGGSESLHGGPNLARPRPEAAPREELQTE